MRVPGNVIEGRGTPFPVGTFIGRLDKVEENASEDKKNLDLVLTFRDISTIGEGPEVGARPFTQRVTVIFNDAFLADVTEFDDNVHFSLRRAAGLLTQIALAVGATTRTQDGSAELDMERFLESLTGGIYKDAQILFEVAHRPWTSKKTGRKGVSSEAVRFAAAEAVVPADAQPA